jgi:hypothetical protein
MPQVPCGQMILHWKILQTHILKYDKLQYIRERRGGAGSGFFLRKVGERLGLVVEEEERLGLALVMSVFNCTCSSVEEFRARQARTRLYCTECES